MHTILDVEHFDRILVVEAESFINALEKGHVEAVFLRFFRQYRGGQLLGIADLNYFVTRKPQRYEKVNLQALRRLVNNHSAYQRLSIVSLGQQAVQY